VCHKASRAISAGGSIKCLAFARRDGAAVPGGPQGRLPKVSPIDIHVGSRLRMRRMMLGMSQEKLAAGFGLTFQQIQKYEKGTNRMGSSRLQQAANILGVTVPFFFEGADGNTFKPDGSAASPAYINDFVSSEDGLRLVQAFMRIGRPAVRHRIVALVNEIAGEDGG
jgi:transcriptional regulator with XRE-family HTH domain